MRELSAAAMGLGEGSAAGKQQGARLLAKLCELPERSAALARELRAA